MKVEERMRTKQALKFFTPITISLGLIVSSGCSSVHPGQIAEASTKNRNIDMKVSAEADGEQENHGYLLVYITFENTSDRWIKISEANVKISPEDADKISVVKGKDMEDWASAMKTTDKLEKHNRNVIQTAILAVAGATALGTASRTGTAMAIANDVSVAAVAGTATYMGVNAIKDSKRGQETTSWVPENHLYQPFSLPAKLFARKWILLNKPASKKINSLKFDVTTAEGESETYEVHL
jgi:hypothetical protein